MQKKKEYNPFATRTVKREAFGQIKCFIKAVVSNPKDMFGEEKIDGLYYSEDGYNVTPAAYGAEKYEFGRVYFYEVGANDGSYRKCTSREAAEKAFAQLIEFEKRQMQIR